MLAEEASEVEDRAGVGGDFWFVHRDSSLSERASSCPLGLMRLLIIKELGGQKVKKRARNGPFATRPRVVRVAPHDSMVRLRCADFGRRRGDVGVVSDLGGVGYGG